MPPGPVTTEYESVDTVNSGIDRKRALYRLRILQLQMASFLCFAALARPFMPRGFRDVLLFNGQKLGLGIPELHEMAGDPDPYPSFQNSQSVREMGSVPQNLSQISHPRLRIDEGNRSAAEQSQGNDRS